MNEGKKSENLESRVVFTDSGVSNKQPGPLFFFQILESGTVIRFWYSCVPNNHGPRLLDFLFLVGAHVYKIMGSCLLALNTCLLLNIRY